MKKPNVSTQDPIKQIKLADISEPLRRYLRENHHPHAAIIVTDERVIVVEDLLSLPFDKTESLQEHIPEQDKLLKDFAQSMRALLKYQEATYFRLLDLLYYYR